MKKLVSFILIMITVASTMLVFAGCNLFNNGSEDEVPGVYGIHKYFYRDVDGETHNYADKYEYYLLVLKDDKTGKVIIKPVDGEESSYDITYTLNFGTGDDAKKVSSVVVNNFRLTSYTKSNGVVSPTTTTTNTSFTFYPVREDLIYVYRTLTKKTDGTKSITTLTTKYYFTKMYNTPSDQNVDKAKVKQKDSIDSRKDTSEGTDEG